MVFDVVFVDIPISIVVFGCFVLCYVHYLVCMVDDCVQLFFYFFHRWWLQCSSNLHHWHVVTWEHMLCECGIYHGWKPNKDGFLPLMEKKETPKHVPIVGVVWNGNRDKQFFCCFYVWFVLFAYRWILAIEYLQGLKGFKIGLK